MLKKTFCKSMILIAIYSYSCLGLVLKTRVFFHARWQLKVVYKLELWLLWTLKLWILVNVNSVLFSMKQRQVLSLPFYIYFVVSLPLSLIKQGGHYRAATRK